MGHTCFHLAVALLLQMAHTAEAHSTHDITWTLGVLPFADKDNTVHVEGGDILKFVSTHTTGGDHDVVKFLDEAHYDTCNFDGSVIVHAMQRMPFGENTVVDDVTSSNDVRSDYYGCSIADECRKNMKVKVMAHRKGTHSPEAGSENHEFTDEGLHSYGPTNAQPDAGVQRFDRSHRRDGIAGKDGGDGGGGALWTRD
jgi:hypothetical protein